MSDEGCLKCNVTNLTMQKQEWYKKYRSDEIAIDRLVDEIWLIDNPPKNKLQRLVLRLHRYLHG